MRYCVENRGEDGSMTETMIRLDDAGEERERMEEESRREMLEMSMAASSDED